MRPALSLSLSVSLCLSLSLSHTHKHTHVPLPLCRGASGVRSRHAPGRVRERRRRRLRVRELRAHPQGKKTRRGESAASFEPPRCGPNDTSRESRRSVSGRRARLPRAPPRRARHHDAPSSPRGAATTLRCGAAAVAVARVLGQFGGILSYLFVMASPSPVVWLLERTIKPIVARMWIRIICNLSARPVGF